MHPHYRLNQKPTMTLSELLEQLAADPSAVNFNDVMQVVTENYDYTPTTFYNGPQGNCLTNAAGTNEGSCRIFAFALDNNLDEQATLHCFGSYYRDDVLGNPDGEDHGNIRNFIKYGWANIRFEQFPLKKKA